MNKEQAAREWALKKVEHLKRTAPSEQDRENVEDFEELMVRSLAIGHIAGQEAGQKQLLDEAVEGLQEYVDSLDLASSREYVMIKKSWQAAKLSCAAELAAKDAEVEKAIGLIKEMRDALKFYDNTQDHRTYLDVFDCIEKESESVISFDSEKFGALARKTLKQNADKIRALLGEE